MVPHYSAFLVFDMDWIATCLDENLIELSWVRSTIFTKLGTHHHENLLFLLFFWKGFAGKVDHVVLRPGHGLSGLR